MYVVVDKLTKKVMGTYKTRRTASNAVDRLDNAYGAYKYQAVQIEEDLMGTETTYVFEDGSKLIRNIDERLGDLWTVETK